VVGDAFPTSAKTYKFKKEVRTMERLTNEEVYRRIARAVSGRAFCLETGRVDLADNHRDTAWKVVEDYLPHGSGFDAGVELDLEQSTEDKLVFHTDFHYMDENGSYLAWVRFNITVTTSLSYGINVEVEQLDFNVPDDYLSQYVEEVFS
jgi:hypothetical protein